MSFKNLNTLTNTMRLPDTGQIFSQGRAAYMGMFTRGANPFKTERDRTIWDKGYAEEQEKFTAMVRRWRDMDRGTI